MGLTITRTHRTLKRRLPCAANGANHHQPPPATPGRRQPCAANGADHHPHHPLPPQEGDSHARRMGLMTAYRSMTTRVMGQFPCQSAGGMRLSPERRPAPPLVAVSTAGAIRSGEAIAPVRTIRVRKHPACRPYTGPNAWQQTRGHVQLTGQVGAKALP
jgi:hypothetical protein